MTEKTTQEQVDELNAALAVGNQTPVQGGAITVHDVDYLEVEVLELPVIDLSMRYMIRFSKPMPMILDTEIVRLGHSLTQINNKSYEERLKDEVRSKWQKMVLDSCGNDLSSIEDESAREMMEKWYNLDDVRIVKLKLVRDEE